MRNKTLWVLVAGFAVLVPNLDAQHKWGQGAVCVEATIGSPDGCVGICGVDEAVLLRCEHSCNVIGHSCTKAFQNHTTMPSHRSSQLRKISAQVGPSTCSTAPHAMASS